MSEEILILEDNILVNEQIRDLMKVLIRNYFTKKDYNHLKIEEAYELCSNYQDMQVLIDTIFTLCIENTKKMSENYDALIKKERERKGVKNNGNTCTYNR